MKYKLFLLVLLLLVLIANIISTTYGIDCSYSTDNGSFTFAEQHIYDRSFNVCERKFNAFKTVNDQHLILYRLCPINIFNFWNWGNYLFLDKFKLPYKPWEEIEKRRGPVVNKSGFQDF